LIKENGAKTKKMRAEFTLEYFSAKISQCLMVVPRGEKPTLEAQKEVSKFGFVELSAKC